MNEIDEFAMKALHEERWVRVRDGLAASRHRHRHQIGGTVRRLWRTR